MTVQLTGIRSIVFDLDDTLYTERSFACSGFDAVAGWLADQMNCPFDAAARMKQLLETEHRRQIFNQVLIEAGCADKTEWIPAMVECYRNHLPSISLMPDAERAIQRWSGKFFLGLISDGPLVMQRQKVRALGLQQRLDLILLTDEWGQDFWKPHPRAFERIQVESGQRGPACLYIADNPSKDFLAPNSLGWRTIRIIRPDSIYGELSSPESGCAEFTTGSLDQVDINT